MPLSTAVAHITMIKTNQGLQGYYCTSDILHRPNLRPFLTGFQAGKPSFARWIDPIEPHKRFITCTAVPAKSAEQQRGSQIRESCSYVQQWALQLGVQCPKLTVADFAGETFRAARLPNIPNSSPKIVSILSSLLVHFFTWQYLLLL